MEGIGILGQSSKLPTIHGEQPSLTSSLFCKSKQKSRGFVKGRSSFRHHPIPRNSEKNPCFRTKRYLLPERKTCVLQTRFVKNQNRIEHNISLNGSSGLRRTRE